MILFYITVQIIKHLLWRSNFDWISALLLVCIRSIRITTEQSEGWREERHTI